MSAFKPIHHTFGPHVNLSALRQQVQIASVPWRWRNGKSKTALAGALRGQWNADVFLFASGREAFLALLRSLPLNPGEEIIIQGYTCVAVPNAIHAAGGTPVYTDIDRNTLNLSVDGVRRAITPRTRAVMCQHTFGIPADAQGLRTLCDEFHLTLIEDCAHIMPDETGPEEIGRHGDVLFFSFGRDKAISGIAGGAALSRSKEITARLRGEERSAVNLSMTEIFRTLLYPLIYMLARPVYGLTVGKMFLLFARKAGMLVPVLKPQEKEGRMSPVPRRMANANAYLALKQWKRLKKINDHRRSLTALYLKQTESNHWHVPNAITQELPLQKFPLFTEEADRIRSELKKKNIHLDDGWTGATVCPRSVNQISTNYRKGSCPQAEEVSKTILTLPTHPTMTIKQAKNLLRILDQFLH